MSKRNQGKRQAKRKAKAAARRREQGKSPLARLGSLESVRCFSQGSAGDEGMESVIVIREVRGGGNIAAFFLIDYTCIGLKDAFYRLDFDSSVLAENPFGAAAERTTLAEAQTKIAAAIRWTREHPFVLPADTERCLKVVGDVPDIEHADTSEFGAEGGGLLYVGLEKDLRRRLKGLSVEEFMAQKGVEVMFEIGAEDAEGENDQDDFGAAASGAYLDDDEEDDEDFDAVDFAEDLAKMGQTMGKSIVAAARKWCFATNRVPHPAMEAAVELMLAASREGLLFEDEYSPEAQAAVRAARTALLQLESPERRDEIQAADLQLQEFGHACPDPDALTGGALPEFKD